MNAARLSLVVRRSQRSLGAEGGFRVRPASWRYGTIARAGKRSLCVAPRGEIFMRQPLSDADRTLDGAMLIEIDVLRTACPPQAPASDPNPRANGRIDGAGAPTAFALRAARNGFIGER